LLWRAPGGGHGEEWRKQREARMGGGEAVWIEELLMSDAFPAASCERILCVSHLYIY